MARARLLIVGVVASGVLAVGAFAWLLWTMFNSALLADDLKATDFGDTVTASQAALNVQMGIAALVLVIALALGAAAGIALALSARRVVNPR